MKRIERAALVFVIAAALIGGLAVYVWAVDSRDHGPRSVHATFLHEEDGVAAVRPHRLSKRDETFQRTGRPIRATLVCYPLSLVPDALLSARSW